MNELKITGTLTEDLFKFIEDKSKGGQTGEQGIYLLGEDKELKIETEVKQKGKKAGVLVVTAILIDILKDMGLKVLVGLLVDFIRDHLKSKKETPEEVAKKLTITWGKDRKTWHIDQIEMVNYSPEEIKILREIFA